MSTLVDKRCLIMDASPGWIRLLCKWHPIMEECPQPTPFWCIRTVCNLSSGDHAHPWMGYDFLDGGCAHGTVLKGSSDYVTILPILFLVYCFYFLLF